MAANAISTNGIINPGGIIQIGSGNNQANSTNESNGTSFFEYLNNAIGSVNNTIGQAENLQKQLATGQIDDIQSVMIATEKADLSLQYTLAIRNKVMDAYSEIMRMQV